MKIRNELDSQAGSALRAQTDSSSGITLSTFVHVTEAMVKLVITKSAPKTSRSHPHSTSAGNKYLIVFCPHSLH